MSARERIPYDARAIQSPGMMRDGPYSGTQGPARPHRALDVLPPIELLENKIASHSAEIERLLIENRRLAASNVDMRRELNATRQELERIHSHNGSIQTESGIQVRGLLEKMRKMEDAILASEAVSMELKQAHNMAQALIAEREELSAEIQSIAEDLTETSVDGKRFPELLAEWDSLRQEHQKIRTVFEYQKGSNTEQVEQMRIMEKNMISMAREIEKLRADIMAVQKGEHSANLYGKVHGMLQPQMNSRGTPPPQFADGYSGQNLSRGYFDSPYNTGRG